MRKHKRFVIISFLGTRKPTFEWEQKASLRPSVRRLRRGIKFYYTAFCWAKCRMDPFARMHVTYVYGVKQTDKQKSSSCRKSPAEKTNKKVLPRNFGRFQRHSDLTLARSYVCTRFSGRRSVRHSSLSFAGQQPISSRPKLANSGELVTPHDEKE